MTNVAVWTGGTNTDWNTASNWSTGGVPWTINDENIPAGALPNEPTIGAFSVNVVALTVGSGHTLTVSAGGSLTSTGVTNLNGTFGGSGGGFTFTDLLVGNLSGAAITGNATVNGTVSLPAGDLNMGSFVLTQPNTTAATGTGDVVGTVRRTGAPLPQAALTYGNPLNTIAFTAAGTRPTQIDFVAPTGIAPQHDQEFLEGRLRSCQSPPAPAQHPPRDRRTGFLRQAVLHNKNKKRAK